MANQHSFREGRTMVVGAILGEGGGSRAVCGRYGLAAALRR